MQIESFKKYVTTENILLFLVVSTGALLGFAFVLEYFVDLVPCPLCIVQRFFYLFIGVSALVGLSRRGRGSTSSGMAAALSDHHR